MSSEGPTLEPERRLPRLDHVAVAVADLEAALPFYTETLGLELSSIEEVPSQKVRIAMLKAENLSLELLEPTEPDSPVGSFLSRRGPGLHHLALSTDDLPARLRSLEEAGHRLIDRVPRPGAEGKRIAFLHPQASGGVLLEFCSKPEPPPGESPP